MKSFVVIATGVLIWSQADRPAAAHEITSAAVIAQRIAQAETKPADSNPPTAQSAQPAPPAAPAPATPPAAPAPAQPPAAAPAPQAPAAKAPAAPSPAAKAPATETPAIVMNGQQVMSILGKKVRGADGTDMGRIVDIIADKSGQLRAAIIDFGGFLGVGSRQIAVDWNAIRFPSDGKTDSVEVDLTRDQLRVAPAYKPGEQIVVLGKPSPTVGAKAPQPSADAAGSPAESAPSK
ncbi:PRC-barrel domain-containing protein [Afipia sp. TerB]